MAGVTFGAMTKLFDILKAGGRGYNHNRGAGGRFGSGPSSAPAATKKRTHGPVTDAQKQALARHDASKRNSTDELEHQELVVARNKRLSSEGYKALDKVAEMQDSEDAFEGSSSSGLINKLSRVTETVATLSDKAKAGKLSNAQAKQLSQGIARLNALMRKVRPGK